DEPLQPVGILHCGPPFVHIGPDVPFHRRVQLFAEAQFVVDDDPSQVLDAAVQPFDPGGGALQAVSGADVVHEEPVDGADQHVGRYVGEEQVGVPRAEAAVAADV